MSSVWNKIDTGLAMIYANYLEVRKQDTEYPVRPCPQVAAGGKVHVLLYYRKDLSPIEKAGFQSVKTDGKRLASGYLQLDDLEAIAEIDEVLTINYGTEPQLALDVSIPQIKANQLWSQGPPPLYQFSGNTGEGVIIGVIDSGVDIHHEFLWRQTIPDIKTRILRIWDMGLIKQGEETSPDPALLDPLSPGNYGVEYTDTQINAVLQGVPDAAPVRHRDCNRHGTHVASIAAGDGRYKYKYIGVAPRADLIIVKHLSLENRPLNISNDQIFKDAVTYIRKVASSFTPPRPVVINYSAGYQLGPHDGMTEIDDWLTDQFQDTTSAGHIFVASAGNHAGNRQHALIELTNGVSTDIPIELYDTREDFYKTDTCNREHSSEHLTLELYYPSGINGLDLQWEFTPAYETTHASGPVLNDTPKQFVDSQSFKYKLMHKEVRSFLIDGSTVTRNLIELTFFYTDIDDYKKFNKIVRIHNVGIHRLTLSSNLSLQLHLWCYQASSRQGLRIAALSPSNVDLSEQYQITSPATAKNAIAVAAYDAEVATLDVAKFSSRGPVPRYDGSQPPNKPDIAAPGVKIDAALSVNASPPLPTNTVAMEGTSMATPHVTGTIALMLQKNPNLTPSEVLAILQTSALKAPPPIAEELGAGRLDAKNAFDNTP